jgi:hypothetical protein
MTSGVEGVKRLFKAFVSAEWIKTALDGWGEDLVSAPRNAEAPLSDGLTAKVSSFFWSYGLRSTRNRLSATRSERIPLYHPLPASLPIAKLPKALSLISCCGNIKQQPTEAMT